jgi:hypothetical protein
MGSSLCECSTVHPTIIYCFWCGAIEWTVNFTDLQKLHLLYHLYIHLQCRRHVCWTGKDIEEVWMVGKPFCLDQYNHYVHCVSHH